MAQGYGWQEPYDSTDPFNVLDFLIRQKLAQVRTLTVVKVVAVHGGGPGVTGTVDVQPLVKQVDPQNNASPHGVVYGLPYFRLQGGKNAIVADPQVDDIGFIICADRDISAVKASRDQQPPGTQRKFDFSDGIYVGACLCPSPDQYIFFSATGIRIVDKNGNIINMSNTQVAITESNGNVVVLDTNGITNTDCNGNIIQMRPGFVNVVTTSFQVNGVPVTVP